MSEKTQARQSTTIMMRLLQSYSVVASGATATRHAVAMLGILWLVSGCTHNLLHDENRDKQGELARKSVAEARLGDAIASLEKSFSEMAVLEEARARDRANYLFDLELRVVARAPSLTSKFASGSNDTDGLQTVVETRLEKLGLSGKTPEQLKAFRSLAPKFQAKQRALEITLAEFRGTVGHQFEDCVGVFAKSSDPTLKNNTPSNQFLSTIATDRQELARTKFPALIDDCKKIDEVLAERDKVFNNAEYIKAIQTRLDRIERDILRYESNMQRARGELDNAMKKFRESGMEVAANPSENSKLASLETRAAQLRDAVTRMGEGTAAFGAAEAHVLATERLKHLQTVLGAIAGSSAKDGVKLSTEEQASVAIVRDLPSLADEADKLLKGAKRPRLVPFLTVIDQQKIVIEGFDASRQTKHKQAKAVRNELEAVLMEASALMRVLEPLTRNKAWATRSISDLQANLAGTEKIEFLRTLAIYADEVQRFRIETAEWGARETAAQYEEAFIQSKFAAAQWDGLTNTIATVLADYHASGIKKAELAEFFKALGLVAIGVGAAL